MENELVTDNGERSYTSMEKFDVSPVIVAGVCVSPDGADALIQMLASFPSDSGAALILIQTPSEMNEPITEATVQCLTDISVNAAEISTALERDNIYILPAETRLSLHAGAFCAPRADAVPQPIDALLTELAFEYGERAAAVMLASVGGDGASGLKAIAASGGFSAVQEPVGVKPSGMLNSAISTGCCDFILPPAQIAEELKRFAKLTAAADGGLSESGAGGSLSSIYYVMQRKTGIDFSLYKQEEFLRHIRRRMYVCRVDDIARYVEYLVENPGEVAELNASALPTLTRFFREPESFSALKERVISRLVAKDRGSSAIRVWVAGCSTGEEAYSIAMLFDECMREQGVSRSIKMFATDVSASATEHANRGAYSADIAAVLGRQRLERYFSPDGEGYRVSPQLRKMITFAPHNLMQDPPFGHLDLICCRGVLTYLNSSAQRTLLETLCGALADGGCLFIGSGESVEGYSEPFDEEASEVGIYLRGTGARSGHSSYANYMKRHTPTAVGALENKNSQTQPPVREGDTDKLYSRLIRQLSGNGALIDAEGEIIRMFGDLSSYVTVPSGEWGYNLLEMLSPQLKLAVTAAVNEAVKRHGRVEFKNIPVDDGLPSRLVDMTIAPLFANNGNELESAAVMLRDTGRTSAPEESESYDISRSAVKRIAQLENELHNVQGTLNSIISQLEESNAGLAHANLEYTDANEKLRRSNEELQLVNMEMRTLNEDYQLKVGELNSAYDQISLLSHAVEQMGNCLLITDTHGVVQYANPRFFEIYALTPGRTIGATAAELFCGTEGEEPERTWTRLCENGTLLHTIRSGQEKAPMQRVNIQPIVDVDGGISNYMIVGDDVTSSNDELTGLINGTVFNDALKQTLQRCDRRKGKLALMRLDVDGFRRINSTLGHACGSELLSLIAKRISERLGEEDCACRMSGDVFAFYIANADDQTGLYTFANRLMSDLCEEFKLSRGTVRITASMGLAVYPDDCESLEELKNGAETALRSAKTSGGSCFRRYTQDQRDGLADRKRIEQELLNAMKNKELTVLYQPVADAEAFTVRMFEAVTVWDSPQRGRLTQDRLAMMTDNAEITAGIAAATVWSACSQLANWKKLGVKAMISVSGVALVNKDFLSSVRKTLEETGCPASSLIFKISEDTAFDMVEEMYLTLARLRELGCKIALDENGMGYSALYQLDSLSLDYLRIDRAYAEKLIGDGEEAMLTAILSIARRRGCISIAHGVDEQRQYESAKRFGCAMVQGDYVGGLMDVEQAQDEIILKS